MLTWVVFNSDKMETVVINHPFIGLNYRVYMSQYNLTYCNVQPMLRISSMESPSLSFTKEVSPTSNVVILVLNILWGSLVLT